jgi:hypothetical protein
MSIQTSMERSFDPSRMRRYIGGCPSTVHPILAAVTYTRTAIDDGAPYAAASLLAEAAEEAFFLALKWIFVSSNTLSIPERKTLAEEHFRLSGLGKLALGDIDEEGGTAELSVSAIDECWVSTYGKPEAPINVLACGYLAGAFAAITGECMKAFRAEEIRSIALGEPTSAFRITRRERGNGGNG